MTKRNEGMEDPGLMEVPELTEWYTRTHDEVIEEIRRLADLLRVPRHVLYGDKYHEDATEEGD